MRPRKCLICKEHFKPVTAWQKICGPACASEFAEKTQAKRERKLQKRQRMEDGKKREAMKTIPQLKKEAQAAFNSWIRWRDKGKTCISCGRPLPSECRQGGRFDAGHYRGVGSADHLRFNEDNVHGQCKQCNKWGSGEYHAYRIGLIDRIGLSRVEALESNSEIVKWTREALTEIRDSYRKRLNEAKKAIHE